jgi:hypothetical protein
MVPAAKTAKYIDLHIPDTPRGVLFNRIKAGRELFKPYEHRKETLKEFCEVIGWDMITPSIPPRAYVSRLHSSDLSEDVKADDVKAMIETIQSIFSLQPYEFKK